MSQQSKGRKAKAGNGSGGLSRDHRGVWIARWTAANGRRRKRSTQTTDKAAAQRILSKWLADEALKRSGVVDSRAEALAQQSRRPIAEHVNDWEAALRAKGTSEAQVTQQSNRASAIAADIKAHTLADIEAAAVRGWIGRQQQAGVAVRTINAYLQALGQLLRWARGDARIAYNPLDGLAKVRFTDAKRTRRALDADELAHLYAAAEAAPRRFGMTGLERAMFYRLAAGTGFRRGELQSLTPASFILDEQPPAVLLAAGKSKRRQADRQPIRRDLAEVLRPWLQGRPHGEPIFGQTDKTSRMIRADLRLARARWIRQTATPAERRRRREADFLAEADSADRVADFHSLRVSYITLLVKAGTSPKVAQALARHSDINLTFNTYTRLGISDTAGALEHLPPAALAPRPSKPAAAEAVATGTDTGRAGPCLAAARGTNGGTNAGASPCIAMHRDDVSTSPDAMASRTENPVKLGINAPSCASMHREDETRPGGFEPPTPGLGNRCSIP